MWLQKLSADRLFELLNVESEVSVIHAGKSQNHRSKSLEDFDNGTVRILIATDVISRGIDLEKVSTVISFDTSIYPENYIHRIGRTGRAEQQGKAILLYTEQETDLKEAIEKLMNYTIPLKKLPVEVEVSSQLTPEEANPQDTYEPEDENPVNEGGAAFHEKSTKNSKGKTAKKSRKQALKERYKKPIRRGDKIQNRKKKRKKKK